MRMYTKITRIELKLLTDVYIEFYYKNVTKIVKLQIKAQGLHRVTNMVNSTQGVGYFYIERNPCLELFTPVICISIERNDIRQEKTMLLQQNVTLLLDNK